MPISFKELSYVYDLGMPYAHKALDDINLDIQEGKITAVIGETGSGKSTLVEHLNALLLPTSGRLEILDHEIVANQKHRFLKQLRKEVGLVFQFSEHQLFEETIIKDVMFGPKNFGFTEEECKKKAVEALKLVGIGPEYYEISPLELSGGQKRRVAIAGILAINPQVIVLDEPTAGLDPVGGKEIINLFIGLNKKLNKTIIIVTHDNEMVYNYCDNTIVLAKGKVEYSGLTLDLFNNKELVDKLKLLEPQIVSLKNELRENGFKVSDNIRTINEVVEEISRQVR
ncbi:MAG: energy-coupling factor transporter ATPase [Erysipelotrichaceae bacterium]|nr:energy-coupling factor transporter ATPase [Erysipelotrichaceae bacterium]